MAKNRTAAKNFTNRLVSCFLFCDIVISSSFIDGYLLDFV